MSLTVRSADGDAQNGGIADVLERVLDKGVVIAGDVSIAVVGVELLTLKVRLLIASVERAEEIGIDWWRSDPFLSSAARDASPKSLEEKKDASLAGDIDAALARSAKRD